MITSTQVLLARTMLKLSQKEAASQLGISAPTLSQIESGETDPPRSRFQQIQEYYESQGVEFIEGNGIRERQTYIQKYSGLDGFRSFMDDVYETAKEYGGDICLLNSKPRIWHELLGEEWYEMHSRRMKSLGNKIRVRITVEEGEEFFVLDSAEHRWFSRDSWKEKVIYAYGPKLGFLDFSNNDIHIILLNQSDFADSFRIIFDMVWESVAKDPVK